MTPATDELDVLRKYVQSGIDYVNYPVNIHQVSVSQYIVFSPRVQRMIVEEAHRAGLPVQATFITTEEGMHMALDAGADIVVPVPFGKKSMSAGTVALLAQRQLDFVFQSETGRSAGN